MHTGVDWAAPTGTPIYAAGNGTVERVGWESGYGKFVLIRHNNGYETAYGHMTAYARNIDNLSGLSGAVERIAQKHVALNIVTSLHKRQRARGRHAEMMHRLAAQKFTDRRAQHRTTIGTTRIRRRARALELQLEALRVGRDYLAQQDRATIAKLPRPIAELMTAVYRRVSLHAGQHTVA